MALLVLTTTTSQPRRQPQAQPNYKHSIYANKDHNISTVLVVRSSSCSCNHHNYHYYCDNHNDNNYENDNNNNDNNDNYYTNNNNLILIQQTQIHKTSYPLCKHNKL